MQETDKQRSIPYTPSTTSLQLPLSVDNTECMQPPKPILQWENLTYKVNTTVDDKAAFRVILNDIHGEAKAGETIAIIGSSGAGKTTLLNALSGRIVGGTLTGRVLYHGVQRNPSTFKRSTAYVQQDDIMHPMLTVEETLTYASQLRLPSALYSSKEKRDRVNDILNQLRLEAIRKTKIGDAKVRGVSGGERKRVSIAAELLTDPRLLFLDEPTSGLDSNSSQLVVELVKNIATQRRIAVLMTIHQPSAKIFNTFDKVILLSQGHLVYFGPTRSAIGYFASIGYQCPVHENPADYFIDVMTLDFRNEAALAESRARVTGLVYSFIDHNSKSCQPERTRFRYLCDRDIATAEYEAYFETHDRNSWISEYKVLAHRDWVNLMRNFSFLISQAVQSLMTALLVGFMFYYLKHDAVSVQNRLGLLYIVALNATFPTIMPALYVFFEERDIMLRERSSAVYRVTTFYVAKATTFVPISLVTSTIFITGVYFISRLAFSASKFFIALSVLSCLNIVSIAFMLMVGSAVKNMDIAFVVAPAIVTIELLFGGLLANPTSIVPEIRWIRWINPVYYAFSAFIQNEFRGLTFECSALSQCYPNGEQVIAAYGMGRFTILQNTMLLLLIGLVFYAAGYVLLRWKAKPRYICI